MGTYNPPSSNPTFETVTLTGDLTTPGSLISSGGGETGKFLTGQAGNTVFSFSGDNFDIRAGSGSSSSQNVMRVKSTGNVGIGTNNPGAKLEILKAGDQLKLSFNGTDNVIFAVDTNGVLTITPSGAAVDFASKALINVLDLDLGAESAMGTIWAMLTAANAGTAFLIKSRDAGDIHRARLGLSGGVDTAVWAWVNSTHTGIVLSGALDANSQDIDNVGSILDVNSAQVVGTRVVDARIDDAINSGDATTDGVIDAIRDALIAHGICVAT